MTGEDKKLDLSVEKSPNVTLDKSILSKILIVLFQLKNILTKLLYDIGLVAYRGVVS